MALEMLRKPYPWFWKIRKYGRVTGTSLQSNLAYTANFFFDTFFYAFLIFIFVQLWRVIYRQGGLIAGYSMQQMIWYCIISEMVVISGTDIFEELNREIKGGNIVYLLNKPYHWISYQLANSMGQSIIKLALNAVIGILMGLLFAGPLPRFHLEQLLLTIWSVSGGILLNFMIQVCLGLSTFWLEENTALFWIYQKLLFMLGMFLPLEFYPDWLGRMVQWLPFPYITYGAAKVAVAFSWPQFIHHAGFQMVYLVFFFWLAFTVYGKGVKKLNVNGG